MSHNQPATVETTNAKPQEDWMARRWRPLMGYIYMAICACDFIFFPILWSMTQAVYHIVPFVQWQPLTLQGAGMIHIAFGAILGIAAFGRTKEKLAGAEQGGVGAVDLGPGTTYQVPGMQPGQMGMNGGMNSGMGGGFGGSNNGGFNSGSQSMGSGSTYGAPSTGGFGSPAPAFGSTPAPAFGSTPAPTFGSTPAPAFGAPPTFNTTPPVTASGKPSGPAQSFPAL